MPGDLRIVDIALLPEFRAQGLGSGLIEAVFAAARVTGSKVSIHVENFNPARRLYERLGFIEVGEHGVYRRMEWQPAVTR
jgi:ribosomal protein S18 acetylase RimI-like enzyme